MLRLLSEPASPQNGLPGGALRFEGRCALRAPTYVALGCHDGNEGEWKDRPATSLEPAGRAAARQNPHPGQVQARLLRAGSRTIGAYPWPRLWE